MWDPLPNLVSELFKSRAEKKLYFGKEKTVMYIAKLFLFSSKSKYLQVVF